MIELKLKILLDNNVISQNVYEKSLSVLSYLAQKSVDEQKLDVFMTHLSMALARMEKDETMNILDDAIYAEVTQSDNYEQAVELTKTIEKHIDCQFPQEEIRYIHLHLAQF